MTHIVSGIILLLLLWGRSLHGKYRFLHSLTMSLVILCDLALIGYLTLAHRVLSKIEPHALPWLLYIHMAMAVLVVGFYILAIPTGLQLLSNPQNTKARWRMRLIDRWVIPLRIGIFISGLGMAYL